MGTDSHWQQQSEESLSLPTDYCCPFNELAVDWFVNKTVITDDLFIAFQMGLDAMLAAVFPGAHTISQSHGCHSEAVSSARLTHISVRKSSLCCLAGPV